MTVEIEQWAWGRGVWEAWRRVIGIVGWMEPSNGHGGVTSPPLMGTGTLMGSGVDWDIGHWCCWGH